MSFLSALFRRSPPAAPPAPFRDNLAIQEFRMPEVPPPARPVEPIRPVDYFDGSTHRYRRVNPVELINVHTELIDQIYQATGMDRLAFRKRVWPMLEYAAAYYQLVPASANNHHREPGGLLLHSLQVARHAAHLGQFARFETDRTRSVSPEDHRAWTVGLILAALTHDSGKLLTDFRVVHPSFFAPGRLLPRLDDGAPPEDERALFVPFDDTIFQWLQRYDYQEYAVHWLANRYGNHQSQSLALASSWLHRMPWIELPEKVRRTLVTGDPRPGTVEADFWEIVTKADHRSATQYFPAIPGDPGAIISDTLRRLVREGAWRPSPDGYPLCVADNQRLLLRHPTDLSQLAVQILQHPQSYVLSAEGPLPVDALVTHLHFASLVEINPATEARFSSSALVSGSTTTQRVVILNESLSRELLELARSAPPAPAPDTPPASPAAVDLRHLSDPVPVPPAPAAAASPPVPTAPSRPTPPPAPPKPQPERLVSDFLDHLRSLHPVALFELDRRAQPRPADAPSIDDLRFESASGGRIVVGRNVVKRFKQRRPDNLDSVFDALTRCTAVIERVDPQPPRPTSYLTLTADASAAVLGRSPTSPPPKPASPPATGNPLPSSSKATPLATVTAPPSAPVSSDPPPDLGLGLSLLASLFSQPSVDSYFGQHGTAGGLNIRTATLAAAIESARRIDRAIPEGLTPDAAAQIWFRCGLPVEIITGGVRLLPDIQRYWQFHVENRIT